MAVADLLQSTLQLTLQTGVDPNSGEATYKTKSFSNVKPTATSQQLYDIAVAFEGLQEHAVTTIGRRDNSEIRLS
jgi:hypothetical protein